MSKEKECEMCGGTGTLFVVKEEYNSFCGLPQYGTNTDMLKEVPCCFCKLTESIYFLNEVNWTDGYEDKKGGECNEA